MSRKRLTQIFPFLLPFRVMQRKICFYAKMCFDGHRYTKTIQAERLPSTLFEASCGMYNSNTGFDMLYQQNKVFNLKLAAKKLNGLLIKPGETISFWKAIRYADKRTPYKDGLTVINGRLSTAPGGGLCQMSNLLFWVFLHSPLTIFERHTHAIKEFPTLRGNEPEGVDATVSEGWLDLKMKNETDMTFQLGIDFDEKNILGSLYVDHDLPYIFEIEDKDLSYFRKNGRVFEKLSIYRRRLDRNTNKILSEDHLYDNLCEIGYQLPEDLLVTEKEELLYNEQVENRRAVRRPVQ